MGVVVLGVGTTPFGRHADASVRTLAQSAARLALQDAGVGPDDVTLVLFANAADGVLEGQEMILGQLALASCVGIGTPVINIENACASGSSAVQVAAMALESGMHDTVLVVGAEKMVFPDKRGLAALSRAMDVVQLVEDEGADSLAVGAGPVLMDVYATSARRYQERTGAPIEAFAAAAAKAHSNGARTEHAHHRVARSTEEVLQSRLVSDPLRLLMCSPLSDGAAAIVLGRQEAHGGSHVELRSSALRTGSQSLGGSDLVRAAADDALARAGVSRAAIGVVEVHDAASSAEPSVLEELGLAEDGQGWRMVLDGDTSIEGRLPVNTGGGLIGRGHPIGATGCAQLVELTLQLRGTATGRQVAEPGYALAENAGGVVMRDPLTPGAAVVTILAAPGAD